MSGSKKRKSEIFSIRSSVVMTLTRSDLPPDVRAEAAGWAERAYLDRSLWKDRHIKRDWLAVVDAVAAVVSPEIARPLQARIEELEDRELLLQEQAGDMAEELQLLRDATVVVQCDDPQHAERDALQARVEELETEVARRKRSGEALNTECEQIGEKADEAWRALNPYMARVELLTAALTEIANRACVGPDVEDCGDEHVGWDAWCDRCKARAALAAGVTESEAPWIRCTCGHSPHKHGDGGTIPPPPTARCHAASDFDHDCPCEGYRPETESEGP